MTLSEVIIVIVVLAVLAFFYLPYYSSRPHPAHGINCVNNLKQIGLAYRVWSDDNNGKYPMQVSVTNGGTMELSSDTRNAWLNYLVMSNELGSPQILYCTADPDHVGATNYSSQLRNKISYFVGLDANTNSPQAFLSGDDNFEISGVPVKPGLLEISSNTPIDWTASRHKFSGNIGLADGSVQQTKQSGLRAALVATNRLAIP